jgi:hypothetical protein
MLCGATTFPVSDDLMRKPHMDWYDETTPLQLTARPSTQDNIGTRV